MGQLNVDNLLPACKPAQFFGSKSKYLDTSLLIETTLVTAFVFIAIKFLATSQTFKAVWFAFPGILFASALIPIMLKRGQLPKIGFNIKQISYSVIILVSTGIVVVPALFAGLLLMKSYGLELPLQPVLPSGQDWICWLFYQFMYVAVAEEVFFRWFLQSNILRLASAIVEGQYRLQIWISIAISAACFAVAHIIVHGQVISALTFFPGVVLGWLFSKTKTLFAPILFHGLSNCCYLLMTTMLT